MSGRRSRARKSRARRTGRAQKTTGQQGPEAEPPPPAPRDPRDEAGVAPAGHVTSSKLAARGHPRVARPEQPQVANKPEKAIALGSEPVPVPAADVIGCRVDGLTPGWGPEPLRLREVQLCLAQEQLLLEEQRRQVQLQMQLCQEEQAWLGVESSRHPPSRSWDLGGLWGPGPLQAEGQQRLGLALWKDVCHFPGAASGPPFLLLILLLHLPSAASRRGQKRRPPRGAGPFPSD